MPHHLRLLPLWLSLMLLHTCIGAPMLRRRDRSSGTQGIVAGRDMLEEGNNMFYVADVPQVAAARALSQDGLAPQQDRTPNHGEQQLDTSWKQQHTQDANIPGRSLQQESLAKPIICSFNITPEAASIECSQSVLLSANGYNKSLLKLNGVKLVSTKECTFNGVLVLSVLTLCSDSTATLVLHDSTIEGEFPDVPQGETTITTLLSVASSGNITMKDSTFQGDQLASAILLSAPSVSVTQCTFAGNMRGLHIVLTQQAEQAAAAAARHQAVLTDLQFKENAGDYGSGALVIEPLVDLDQPLPAFKADIALTNVSFIGNSASYSGFAGAAYFYFRNNRKGSYTITIADTVMENNEAWLGGAVVLDFGGSVDTAVNFTAVNSTFSANTAVLGGGILANFSGSARSDFTTSMINTVLESNRAIVDFDGGYPHALSGSGGALLLSGSDCSNYNPYNRTLSERAFCTADCSIVLSCTNTSFVNNTATSGGGAVRIATSVSFRGAVRVQADGMKLLRNTGNALTLNKTTTTQVGYGGALVVEIGRGHEASITLAGTSLVLDGNTGDVGGGMSLQSDADSKHGRIKVKVSELLVVGNTASYGAGIALLSADAFNVTITSAVQNMAVVGNVADVAGGGVYIDATSSTSMVELKAVKLAGNISSNVAVGGPGGGVAILYNTVAKGHSSVSMEGWDLVNNSAALSSGGSVYVYGNPQDECKGSKETSCWKPVLSLDRVSISDSTAVNGGGIFVRNGTTEMVNVSFIGNTAILSGGGLYSQGSFNSSIRNSAFVGNTAVLGGGAVYGTVGDAQEPNNLKFTNTVMTSNSASKDGGAIFLTAGTAELHNCTVQANVANYRGGAIYFANICGLEDAGCYIASNAATDIANNSALTGGALFLELPAGVAMSKNRKALSNSTNNNSARFGPNLLFAPSESALQVLDNSNVLNRTWTSTSGVRGQIPLRIQAGDAPGVRVQVDVWSDSRTGGHAVYLTGFLQGTDETGVAEFPDLHLIGGSLLHTEAEQAGKSPLLKAYILQVSTPDWQHVKPKNLTVQIRGCVVGEAFQNANRDISVDVVGPDGERQVALQTGTCDLCLTGSYAALGSGVHGQCDPCPSGNSANCSDGVITPTSGYWQGAVGSNIIQACPNPGACRGSRSAVQTGIMSCLAAGDNNSSCTVSCQQYTACVSVCLPGDAACWDDCSRVGSCLADCAGGGPCAERGYSNMFCSQGYNGFLCGSCQEGYGSYKLLRCGRCMSLAWTWVLYAVVVLVVSTMVIFISCTVINAIGSLDMHDLRVSEVFKVLTTHIQMLSVIGSLLVDWPATVKALLASLNFLQGPTETGIISLDCLGLRHSPGGKLWMSLAFPFIVAVIALTMLMLLKQLPHFTPRVLPRPLRWLISVGGAFAAEPWKVVKAKHLAFITIMVSVFFLYTTLVSTAFTPLTCILVGFTGQSHWGYNMDTVCWSIKHYQAGLAPAIVGVLWLCVIVPLFNFISAQKVGSIDDMVTSQVMFNFLFRQYREGMYNWELYAVLHQACMVAVGMFGKSLGAYHQLLLLVLLLLANNSFAHILHPFRKMIVHILHLTSITLMLLTCTAILALKDADRVFTPGLKSSHEFSIFQRLVSALVAIIHVLFVVWCLMLLVVIQTVKVVRTRGMTSDNTVHAAILRVEKFVSEAMWCKELDQDMHMYGTEVATGVVCGSAQQLLQPGRGKDAKTRKDQYVVHDEAMGRDMRDNL